MSEQSRPRQFREQIVGKTVAGVIARPGRNGEPPTVLLLRFDDGTVVEFVSPRSDQVLRQAMKATAARSGPMVGSVAGAPDSHFGQLPLAGLTSH